MGEKGKVSVFILVNFIFFVRRLHKVYVLTHAVHKTFSGRDVTQGFPAAFFALFFVQLLVFLVLSDALGHVCLNGPHAALGVLYNLVFKRPLHEVELPHGGKIHVVLKQEIDPFMPAEGVKHMSFVPVQGRLVLQIQIKGHRFAVF